MKITLSKTVKHNGHTYKDGIRYTVTNELGAILLEKELKINNKNKKKWQQQA